ncbi:mavicyanin [Ziziphus jujuba]|uniref:Mavicyanin n=2 Tax=Ziziphus jujuba TaxID=326968 RepID=A0A6P4AWZ0_ZIZJJ|nr:mavicyanin [Ziziphus jujuba]XP_048337038.1 mavicyanin-like [Ziziphus jujuba var. spinosa]KAH7518845.1 hypothetical protein FEM48_Zijuj09G0214500 [Ziziphus jujuba var. spinosa]
MGLKNTFFLVLVFFVALITKEAQAEKHVVGGSQGWDESTDFKSWVSGEKFKVGDELVFKYTSGLHSVVELGSESAYKSCDLTTALDSKSSGNDVVKLDKAGTRYFACGTMGHCNQGMKVKITVQGGSGNSPSSSPSSPSSSSSGSSTTTSAASTNSYSFASLVMVASVLAIFMFSMF